jgi:hypothetical protein
MRLIALTAALTFSSLLPIAARAQCAGDIDDSGAVSIDEIIQVVNTALGGCDDVLYNEEFNGDSINASRWVVSTKDSPEDGLSVHDGSLYLVTGTAAVDIPYLESWVVPFPATGGFRLEVALQFSEINANGPAFTVLDANGGTLVRITAQFNEPAGLTASVPGAWLTFNQVSATAEHRFTMTFLPAGMFISIGGDNASGPFQVDHRPRTIWMGFPTAGQVYGVDYAESTRPDEADICGRLEYPIPTIAPWSPMRVDYITVTRTEQRPH